MVLEQEAFFNFTKMHGLGNDFVFIDNREKNFELPPIFIQALSDRKRGIGFDQLIVVCAPQNSQADVGMRIFNADGREVGACGNATRCLGALLNRETSQHSHVIESPRGLLKTYVHDKDQIEVNMGPPLLAWDEIPLSKPFDPLFLPIQVKDFDLPCAVSMGNPHLVFFVSDLDNVHLERKGKELSFHPLFPEQTNVEFVQIIDRRYVKMRVWERGTGVTESCASGACAVVVAGVLRGLLENQVTVELDGGSLEISYDGDVSVRGPVSFVYSGVLDTTYFL